MGESRRLAAATVGISEGTGVGWDRLRGNGEQRHQLRIDRQLASPKPPEKLSEPARRALEDFAFWRLRYLGRRSTPWQEEAAYSMVDWLLSPETEFAVVNCPPGSGKSTLFTHDIVAWMICRDRHIRILLGSRTFRLASQYSNRVRRLLERVRPLAANPAQGRPEPAEGCLAQDYGRFRPEYTDIWRQHEFTVTSADESPLEDKEPTVAAYGMDSEFLGARANLVIWDDLVVGSVLRTFEAIEQQRKWWEEEGQTRVEPGGVLLLQGQRMGPEDLYRYSLDQKLGEQDDGTESEESRYRHVIYPAHFEDRCQNDHGKDAKPYPEGCLLDPIRLPWRGTNGLTTIMRNRSEKYRVQYQQEDVDPISVLVQKIWVDGGRDSDGVQYPGCWDKTRGLCQLPHNLQPPFFSIATADPSPTKMWAVQWWVYQPASEQRFLMDLERRSMDAPDFLDRTPNGFSGLAHDWQLRSVELGYPITHWIIENNAAQRFLLQYDFVKAWTRHHRVQIIAHSTTRNKLDPDYGIQMLRNVYKFGNVNLPGLNVRDATGMKDPGRYAAMKLIDEVTRYSTDGSSAGTDDCMMAQWFLEYHLPTLSRPVAPAKRLKRPSWMQPVGV